MKNIRERQTLMSGQSPAPKESARILLAEDEEMVRRLTRNMLMRMGFQVIEACDGAEALDYLDRQGGKNVDLLITDVIMPRMDGKQLVEAVQTRYPEIRILVTSGYTDDIHGICPREEGFLPKPFDEKKLRDKVRGLLSSMIMV